MNRKSENGSGDKFMIRGKLNNNILKKIESRLSIVSPSYLEMVKTNERRILDFSICDSGLLSETELLDIYLWATGLPTIDEDSMIEPVQPSYMTIEYMIANNCLPLAGDDSEQLKLLIFEPYQLSKHRYFLNKLCNKIPDFYLVRRSMLERMLARVSSNTDNNIRENGIDSLAEQDEETLKSMASEAKIVRLVNEIFLRAVEQRASDIHIEPHESELCVRFRVDGILHNYVNYPLSQYPAIASRIKLIGGLNIAEHRLPQDGRTNFICGTKELDIRISTIPTILGESIVLRILRKDTLAFDLAKKIGRAHV